MSKTPLEVDEAEMAVSLKTDFVAAKKLRKLVLPSIKTKKQKMQDQIKTDE